MIFNSVSRQHIFFIDMWDLLKRLVLSLTELMQGVLHERPRGVNIHSLLHQGSCENPHGNGACRGKQGLMLSSCMDWDSYKWLCLYLECNLINQPLSISNGLYQRCHMRQLSTYRSARTTAHKSKMANVNVKWKKIYIYINISINWVHLT